MLLNPFSKLKIAAGKVRALEKPVLFAPLARLASDLPVADARPPEPETGGRAREFSALLQVLLVEDNAVNQQVASEMLSRLGIKADLAEHGEQALAMATRTQYDLILMDCNMPVMDGYEATRRIRALEVDHKTPIIAMTAATGEEEQRRALDAGFSDFLYKPVLLEALSAMVSRWVPVTAPDVDAGTAFPEVREQRTAYSSAAMQELRDSVGDVTYRMVESFLEDTPVYLDSLKSALLENDPRRVYEIAHALKGSASNFGAAPFLEVVSALEKKGKAGDLAGGEELVSACGERFAELRKELERYQLS